MHEHYPFKYYVTIECWAYKKFLLYKIFCSSKNNDKKVWI